MAKQKCCPDADAFVPRSLFCNRRKSRRSDTSRTDRRGDSDSSHLKVDGKDRGTEGQSAKNRHAKSDKRKPDAKGRQLGQLPWASRKAGQPKGEVGRAVDEKKPRRRSKKSLQEVACKARKSASVSSHASKQIDVSRSHGPKRDDRVRLNSTQEERSASTARKTAGTKKKIPKKSILKPKPVELSSARDGNEGTDVKVPSSSNARCKSESHTPAKNAKPPKSNGTIQARTSCRAEVERLLENKDYPQVIKLVNSYNQRVAGSRTIRPPRIASNQSRRSKYTAEREVPCGDSVAKPNEGAVVRLPSHQVQPHRTKALGIPSLNNMHKLSTQGRVPKLFKNARAMYARRCLQEREEEANTTKELFSRTRGNAPIGKANDLLVAKEPVSWTNGQTQRTLFCAGMRVAIVDNTFKVIVADMVPTHICDLILQMADDHVLAMQAAYPERETWRKLYTYTAMDLPCCEVPSLQDITDQIISNVIAIVGKVFHAPVEARMLQARTWKEPHLLRYQKVPGMPSHTGVEMHFDGSHITWQVMLSDTHEYTGGGTYFSCLNQTVKLKKGQVLIHPGALYHKGVDIKSGARNLLICFMDGFDPQVRDTSDWTSAAESNDE